jgi:transcriptional regulator with XRE-family HTH domain
MNMHTPDIAAEDANARRLKARGHAGDLDALLGVAIRARRRNLGLSQQTVAERLGCTFQQVQKYERGTNRVSAVILFRLAEILQIGAGFFFSGLPGEHQPDTQAEEREVNALAQRLLFSPAGTDLAQAYIALPRARQRLLASVAQAMAAGEVEGNA